jgi:catechol 2,3-dioxygenase-like lactoylglutathione lyase family enzyme
LKKPHLTHGAFFCLKFTVYSLSLFNFDEVIMSLDAVGIITKNVDESIKFYKILGIDLVEVGGPGHLEGTTSSGVRIMLDSEELVKEINPEWKEVVGSGIVLCFVQESPKCVDKLFSDISQAGFKVIKEPWDAFWGQRYSSVLDPNGNQIDIVAALEIKKL